MSPSPVNAGPFLHVVKKESVAITLLFFSALGLLPPWASLLLAAYGISRLVVALYQANASLADLRDVGIRLGRLTAQNQGLENQRAAAAAQRDNADQLRAHTEHALGILQLEHDRQTDQLGDFQKQNADLAQRLLMEEQVLAELRNQVQAQGEENRLLQEGIHRRDQERGTLEGERDQALLAKAAALLEKEDLERQLYQAKLLPGYQPFLDHWAQIEERRNAHLEQITTALRDALQQKTHESLATLDILLQKTLPDLQAQKKDLSPILAQAINALPPGHASVPSLEKLRLIWDFELKSLEQVASLFALRQHVQ